MCTTYRTQIICANVAKFLRKNNLFTYFVETFTL